MITVKATREGLVGDKTSTGWIIDSVFPFVALPSEAAKEKWVVINNPLNGKWCCAQVRDTGPHFTDDDNYVFHSARPKAESVGWSNKAGIDLGEAVWNLLEMKDNTDVQWEFIEGFEINGPNT